MCLITKHKEPFIADRDITCYKILRKRAKDRAYTSPYRMETVWDVSQKRNEFISEFTGKYDDVIRFHFFMRGYRTNGTGDGEERTWWHGEDVESRTLFYGEPYDTYRNLMEDDENARIDIQVDNELVAIGEGLHSFTFFRNMLMMDLVRKICQIHEDSYCVRFIIPKGTKYYVSDNGEAYTSEKLVFDGIAATFSPHEFDGCLTITGKEEYQY